MTPEEFGKAVYCPARRSVKEGSRGPLASPPGQIAARASHSQTHEAQWFATAAPAGLRL